MRKMTKVHHGKSELDGDKPEGEFACVEASDEEATFHVLEDQTETESPGGESERNEGQHSSGPCRRRRSHRHRRLGAAVTIWSNEISRRIPVEMGRCG